MIMEELKAAMKIPLNRISSWWRTTVENDVILKDYRCFKDVECSLQGLPSTPSTDNITDIYESISGINRIPLHYDVIKLTLEELSKFGSNHCKIPNEIEWHNITLDNVVNIFRDASDLEINIAFLWAAFLKKTELFGEFLKLGAQISFYEYNYGLSSLHLVAFSGCKQGAEFLLSQRGCYVNLMCKCFSPLHCAALGDHPEIAALLLEKGANIDALTNDLHCHLEGVLHCAVRANAVGCVKLFCDKGANINQLDSSGKTAIHLAAELGHTECLRVLVEAKGTSIDQQTKEKQQTALHFAAQNSYPECIDVLLLNGASVNIPDYKLHTPLHLAARNHCNQCVKLLLRNGEANPNFKDTNQRTALHLAVIKSSRINICDTIKTLIKYGADVNAKDCQEFTPLHLAASNELSECVETLILNNADITAKCKSGITALSMICRKSPTSIDAIRKKLDDSIIFNSNDLSNGSSEVQIDFSNILQHSYPKEIQYLSTLLEEGQKELLLHPVCRAFLYLKWKKIRKFLVFKAISGLLLVICMSSYVMNGLAKHCYNYSKNISSSSMTTHEQDANLCLNHSFLGQYIATHPFIIEMEWYLMLLFAVAIIIRKLCAIPGYSSIRQYLFSLQTFFDVATVLSIFLISFIYTGRTYIWQNHVSAFAVLIAWSNFLNTMGQFPFFGTYIAMYSSVQREFAKLLLVFSCLLIGFTVSFCVLFPNSEVFSNIYIGFITVLVMAIGEMNLDLITAPTQEDSIFILEGSMEIIYATFVTCVTIILLNLLVGIAVHDIKGLKKTAKLSKLTKMTELISCIERALFTDYFHRKLSEIFHWTTLVSTKEYWVLSVKVQNPAENILPLDILQSVYEVARKQKRKQKNNYRKMCVQGNQKSLVSIKDQLKKNFNANDFYKESDINELKNDMTNLNNEIINIKSVLESNQRLMEEILRIIKSEDE